jgi:YidC/Oxa1 family membrane protein insertase
MNDQKNTLLAIVLSAIVLIVWQYFIGMPQMEKQKQEAQIKAQQQQQTTPTTTPSGQPTPAAQPGQPGAPPVLAGQCPAQSSADARRGAQASPRINIETPRLRGSIALRADDWTIWR